MNDDCTCGGACGDGLSGGGGTCDCGGACGGHDERLAPAPLHNPPGRTALDYRVGEYGSFLAAQLDRLASPAYPALKGLTVRTPDDPAIGLLDATAVLGDLLTFHSERIADEAYLRTADEHRSLALLGRLVGHRPRPGVAASTHLAYSLERDPRAETLPVVIPRGAQSHSVPASADEESQTFETSRDLTARWDWNELKVRRRRPSLVTPADLERRSELFVEGTANSLQTGDQLLFVFGEQAGTDPKLLPVAKVRIDRDDEITAIGLARSAPPTLRELVDEVRRWTSEPEAPGDPGDEPPTPEVPNPRPVSRLIEDFDDQSSPHCAPTWTGSRPRRASRPALPSPWRAWVRPRSSRRRTRMSRRGSSSWRRSSPNWPSAHWSWRPRSRCRRRATSRARRRLRATRARREPSARARHQPPRALRPPPPRPP